MPRTRFWHRVSVVTARVIVPAVTTVTPAMAAALLVAAAIMAGEEILPSTIVVSIAGVLSSLFLFMTLLARRGLPSAYNVALIGYRQSGKTTLLVTMFSELVLFRVSKVSAMLVGKRTIERVTSYMKRIKLRQAVGSTTQRSRFPYELKIAEKGLLGRSFRVSFGDFPGERSEEYLRKSLHEHYGDGGGEYYDGSRESTIGEWALSHQRDDAVLFDGEFFRWILECDALVFVVDVAQYLKGEHIKEKAMSQSSDQLPVEANYVVDISQEYIRAWSYIVDARLEGGGEADPVVVLAFTKSDLFDVDSDGSAEGAEGVEGMVARLGFEEPLPEVREISRSRFEEGRRRCTKDFSELIRFLEGHSKSFSTVYTSSLSRMDERMLGVESLFRAVLPRSFR